MSNPNPSNPFVEAQSRALVEALRLLEFCVAAPLGLNADIRMMRESLGLPYSADLGRGESAALRRAHAGLSDDRESLALAAVEAARGAAEALAVVRGDGAPSEGFIRRARMTLERAERKVAGDIRAKIAERVRGIYVIVDPEATRGRDVEGVARQALEGGAKVVQLRDKVGDKGETLETANNLKALCGEFGALFAMNDHADLARASGADVLHVGQTDLPIAEARRILEARQLVGNSNGGLEEARRSWDEGADYIAVGAVYRTTTMGKSGRRALGAETIKRVKEAVDKPLVAIGGINAGNIREVAEAGADSACVVSAITFAEDPRAAAAELVGIWSG